MTLKRFKADVVSARQKVTGDGLAGVLDIKDGISDGEIVLVLQHPELSRKVRLHVLAQDPAEYPDGNMFMLYTEDEPPAPIERLIASTVDYLPGLTVYEVASEISRQMKSTEDMSEDQDEEDVSGDDFCFPHEADDDYADELFGLKERPFSASNSTLAEPQPLSATDKLLLSRIRRDLRQAHDAGFKVGLVSKFGQTAISGIVSISTRVERLGLSEEVLEAWDLENSEYIVLLLRFQTYRPLETILEKPASSLSLSFRIGKCKKYKPSEREAMEAFVDSTNPGVAQEYLQDEEEQRHAIQAVVTEGLQKFFISNSLNQFLNESFVPIVKIRQQSGHGWDQANELYQNLATNPNHQATNDEPMPDAKPERHPVLGDHLQDAKRNERSFPLVAMQFAMRYLVKCTEYCLRCHRKIEAEFEALQPYVCDNPLCLFQYMSMGFGPSIEPIILNEPYVVDLLVSLCYAAVQTNAMAGPRAAATSGCAFPIRSLPVGLRFSVPNLLSSGGHRWRGILDGEKLLLCESVDDIQQLARYRWIAVCTPENMVRHARVQEVQTTQSTAILSLSQLQSYVFLPADPVPFQAPADLIGTSVRVFPYDTDFDTLDEAGKGLAIRQQLDNLPPILKLESWLTSHPQSPLKAMDEVSPAAASILQWIVSSNRSCIYQVDRRRYRPSPSDVDRPAGKGRDRHHQRILGMDSWVQFRFAQGSPEKERQFTRALQEVARRKDFKGHPTILAWHGSHLANWHSILRTGLDFKVISCGRAFGNGVYFSPDFNTSVYYAGVGAVWPNSDLQITQCMSLNEIINVPEEFVSTSPHYVVSQLDWQQCRYLFVKPRADVSLSLPASTTTHNTSSSTTPPSKPGTLAIPVRSQQKGREVKGEHNHHLQIPLCAIPPRVVQATGADAAISNMPAKRARDSPELSEDEDAEDVALLGSDTETDEPSTRRQKRMSLEKGDRASLGFPTPAHDEPMTDFIPGTLDFSTLPRLPPPLSGNDSAIKALSRELKTLQSLQSKTPLHELGWFIDFDKVENLFQWIVELHSFESCTPLAQDMKKADVKSLVFEIRFPKSFPFNPPFVRAIRPMFLNFLQGGGGHVTAGGAMCMELLTSSGWSPANSMESVLMQIRMALLSDNPRPARLVPIKKGGSKYPDYGVGEAIEAYKRAAGTHGWVIPSDFFETAMGVQ
ncbi:putative ubiquitin-conjugating enzyme [Triangularia verruculosa]|uniref:Ubiquitin-conjugating enzyme n=1 Tax=Triangularia verruculosa TaxID=2587418 RepID=A0AAN6XRT2_9PEZI|nr:putative ubiquitin-conjugating enzyme [Triangularia verruculosa]